MWVQVSIPNQQESATPASTILTSWIWLLTQMWHLLGWKENLDSHVRFRIWLNTSGLNCFLTRVHTHERVSTDTQAAFLQAQTLPKYLEERCFGTRLVIHIPGFANGHYNTLHVWSHHCLPKEGNHINTIQIILYSHNQQRQTQHHTPQQTCCTKTKKKFMQCLTQAGQIYNLFLCISARRHNQYFTYTLSKV